MTDDDHTAVTRASFARQADRFDDPRLTLADPQNLGWMTAAIAASPADTVLDVASGTGLLALALAPQVARVVSFDMTPAMQARAVAKARAQAVGNIAFELGPAEALPFGDAAFDIVTCRLAFHHFVDPEVVLREMRRVVKPAGKLAVIDLVAPDDDALAARYNHVERLRDPSHTRALGDAELAQMFARCAVSLVAAHRRSVEVSVQRWLDLTDPEPAVRRAIADALEAELAGDAATGMAPFRKDDGLYFTQRWAIYLLTPAR